MNMNYFRETSSEIPTVTLPGSSQVSDKLGRKLTLGVYRALDQESKGRQNQDPACAEVPPREQSPRYVAIRLQR